MQYCATPEETGESEGGAAVLKDISLGGIYFKVRDPVSFKTGQVLEFTIRTSSHDPMAGGEEPSSLKGEGKIVRLDPPAKGSPFFGVGVQFMQPLDLSAMVSKPPGPKSAK
jgi:hypothetical protein